MKPEDDFTSWRYVLRESFWGMVWALGIVGGTLGVMYVLLTVAYG